MEKKFRIESDTLGEVKIDQNALWGPQTQRSINNFKIGQPYSMPIETVSYTHLTLPTNREV